MIILTGATGTIGSHVVRRLSEAGVPARALSRNPSRGQPLPHLTWMRADLEDPSTLIPAFEGGTVLFLLSSAVLKKRVRYVSEEPEAARARLIALGVAPWMADDFMAIASYHRAGGATATITHAVADLTGRRPRTVVEFAYEHADAFR